MAKTPKSEWRFQLVSDEGDLSRGNQVLRDRETGVLYLFHYAGYAGGLTVLMDKDGKPLTQTFDQH